MTSGKSDLQYKKLNLSKSRAKKIRKGKNLTPEEKEIRKKALDALSLARREKWSLKRASESVGLQERLVIAVTNPFTRVNGRSKLKPYDRISRSVRIYEKGRERIVEVKDSRYASLIGRYHNTVKSFLEAGDSSLLRKLPRRSFKDSRGRIHFLETRPEKIYDIKRREPEPEHFKLYSG